MHSFKLGANSAWQAEEKTKRYEPRSCTKGGGATLATTDGGDLRQLGGSIVELCAPQIEGIAPQAETGTFRGKHRGWRQVG